MWYNDGDSVGDDTGDGGGKNEEDINDGNNN